MEKAIKSWIMWFIAKIRILFQLSKRKNQPLRAGFQNFVDYCEKLSNFRFLDGLLEIQQFIDALHR